MNFIALNLSETWYLIHFKYNACDRVSFLFKVKEHSIYIYIYLYIYIYILHIVLIHLGFSTLWPFTNPATMNIRHINIFLRLCFELFKLFNSGLVGICSNSMFFIMWSYSKPTWVNFAPISLDKWYLVTTSSCKEIWDFGPFQVGTEQPSLTWGDSCVLRRSF